MDTEVIENWLELKDIAELARPEELRLRKLIGEDILNGNGKVMFEHDNKQITFVSGQTNRQVTDIHQLLEIWHLLTPDEKTNITIRAELNRSFPVTVKSRKANKVIKKITRPYTSPPSVTIKEL